MATEYISEVQLPGDATYKKVKDSEARSLISTNRANILYVADQIGKNQLDISLDTLKAINTSGTWNGNVYTLSVGTVTVNADGSITVKKTSTASRILFYLSDHNAGTAISGTKFAGYIISGCPPTGSNTTYGLNGEQTASPWSSIAIEYGNGYTINTSSVPVYFYISLNAAYTTPSDGLTFKPMICTAEAWSISHEFEPYALPNHDLTYLQAEDRAALAEEIDAGAKNSLQLTGTDSNPNMLHVYWDYANGSVRVTGSSPTTDTVYIILGTWTAPQTGSYYLIADGITSTADMLIYDDGNWTTYTNNNPDQSKSALATWTKGTSRNIFLRISSGITVGDITIRPMICTKAAFGISTAFVPYTKSNSQLTTELGSVKTVLEAIL